MKYTVMMLTIVSSAYTYTASAGQTQNEPFDLDTVLAPYEQDEQTNALATYFQSIGDSHDEPLVEGTLEAETITHAAIIALKRRGYPMLPSDSGRDMVQELFSGYDANKERMTINSFDMLCIDNHNLALRQTTVPESIPQCIENMALAYRLIHTSASQLQNDKGIQTLTACIETYLRALPQHAIADA